MKIAQAEQVLCPETELSENLDRLGGEQNSQLVSPDYPVYAERELQPLRLPSLTGQQAATVASVALVGVCVTAAKIVSQSVPMYEGTFQIAVVPNQLAIDSIGTPQIEDTNQNIGVGRLTVDYEALVRTLKTPRVINPIVARLQAQGIEGDHTSLADNLHVKHHENSRTIEVSYRAQDQQTVQRVLAQVVQAYLQEGQACQTSACQGVQFIEAQLPQLQQRVKALQTKLQAFQQQHGDINPVIQGQQLSLYAIEIAKQEAEVKVKLDQARDQFKGLQQRLGIETDSAIAVALLNRDPAYRRQLAQLQSLENQLINEFKQPQLHSDRLKFLNQSYQKQLTQLYHQAQLVLMQQVSNHADLQTALLNHSDKLRLLKQWIDAACYLQILKMRQQTIATLKHPLSDRMNQWAALSEHYTEIQQELQSATIRLNQYLAERQTLQVKSEVQEISWNLTSPPQMIRSFASRIPHIF